MNPTPKLWWLVILSLIVPQCAHAHRLDDLLQATFIEISPTEIHLQLNENPGQGVADRLIWMIDRNGDREISPDETRVYAKSLVNSLKLSIDNQPIAIELVSAESGSTSELQSGDGNVRIEARATLPPLRSSSNTLRLENSHLPQLSAYLVNAVAPKSPGIKILKQQRTEDQKIAWIDFSIEVPRGHPWFRLVSIFAITAIPAIVGFVRSKGKERSGEKL